MNSPVMESKRQPPVLPDDSPSTPSLTTVTVLLVPSGFAGIPSFRYGPKRNCAASKPVQASLRIYIIRKKIFLKMAHNGQAAE